MFFPGQIPHFRDAVPRFTPNLEERRFPASDRYCCLDLPAFVRQLFAPLGGVFRRNIDEEKSLSLVAIQPG